MEAIYEIKRCAMIDQETLVEFMRRSKVRSVRSVRSVGSLLQLNRDSHPRTCTPAFHYPTLTLAHKDRLSTVALQAHVGTTTPHSPSHINTGFPR
jgi:hypothetical protein